MMLKKAYDRGYAVALEKVAGAEPGAAMTLLERLGKATTKPTVAAAKARPAAQEGERVLDYSGWARQPTRINVPQQSESKLSPKAEEAMRAFNYRPG